MQKSVSLSYMHLEMAPADFLKPYCVYVLTLTFTCIYILAIFKVLFVHGTKGNS